MSKLVVTGGAGFIGSHLTDKLVALGHEVAVVDNLMLGKKEFINKKAKFYKADIRDRNKIKKYSLARKPFFILPPIRVCKYRLKIRLQHMKLT